VSLKCASYTRF